MKTIKLEETEIPGAVLSREVDESGTAIITLRMVEDAERGRYEVKVRMDCKFWVKYFDDLGKALVEYKASVSYYQRQADYFNQMEY